MNVTWQEQRPALWIEPRPVEWSEPPPVTGTDLSNFQQGGSVFTYRKDQELPSLPVTWKDRDGAVRDFSTGWTFTVKMALADTPTVVLASKSSGITGASTAPNVVIDWAVTDWDALTASAAGIKYVAHIYARRTADSKDAVFPPIEFYLQTAPAAA